MHVWNTETRYGVIAKLFHWLIGVTIIGLLAVGLYMEGLPGTPSKWQLYGLHKSTGMVVLFLVTLRILWRWGNATVKLPDHMEKWQRLASHTAHGLLYFLMLAIPLSGWLMSSAGGFKVSIYGWVTVPPLIDKNPDIGKIANLAHEYLGYVIIAILVTHVVAALMHHFYYKDNVLKRMLPFGK